MVLQRGKMLSIALIQCLSLSKNIYWVYGTEKLALTLYTGYGFFFARINLFGC
jgi:hypothetical protein